MAGPWVFYMQRSFLHISTLSCTCCDAEARSLISLLFSSRPLSPWFELEQISGLLSGKCSWRLFPRAATSVAACAQVGRRVHWRDSGKAAQGLGLECFRVVLIFGTWFRCATYRNTSQDCVHVCDVWDAQHAMKECTCQGLFGIPSYWKLVFTGHSLGASLAILAATLAEARCSSCCFTPGLFTVTRIQKRKATKTYLRRLTITLIILYSVIPCFYWIAWIGLMS